MSAAPPFDLSDPEWYAHRFVEGQDAFRFIRLSRADHRAVPFLTDAYLGDRGAHRDVPASEVLGLEKGRLHFLFHSAFCGSTLLTSALDRPGVAMGLSEPVLFNDVTGFRLRGAQGPAVARAADLSLRLLARPYGPGEAVVVKPSNLANPLAELFLAVQDQARAVFLYAPLETFLISVVRKGLPCRLWVRELLEGYLRMGYIDLGFEQGDYFRQSDLQIAAVGWLAQHAHFARLVEKLSPARIATLDADRMTQDPAAALMAVAGHCGLTLDSAAIAEIVAGPTFGQHSKSGAAFTSEDRSAEYAAARAAHGEEIDMVLEWARRVADTAGVALSPPNPLLS
ncbi:MAG: hypothetical protein KGZ65_15855 [Sphingomonadales bacterium]|nr:hypothetical protein [Sphingomonadaceae bacterium]MBS3932698.1 hypothetical protein [Sphingomonadales bacterium]